ncbi:MAG: radical SAM family heme chaperone HemW [Phycisphaerae bacterium]
MPTNSIPLPTAPPVPAYKAMPAILRGRGGEVRALYIHIPFCTYKCDYCDFYSLAGHADEYGRYLDTLERQMRLETEFLGPIFPETVFIGGGTPTLLPPDDLRRLMVAIRKFCPPTQLVEFTVESNPNTFDAARAAVLADAGVNRISFGAQSFQPAELTALQRDHDPQSVGRAVQMARAAGITNINLDLIYAIPGQTLRSLNDNLDAALALEPEHLSCYGLMYEPNTPMTARLRRGQINPVGEELELEMMELVSRRLRSAGFERYEISNWSKPDRACRHNLHYWNAANHLAWGVSASGHHSGVRWKYVSSLHRYCDALESGRLPLVELEQLSPARRRAEAAVLQLRLAAGIDPRAFQDCTDEAVVKKLSDVIQKYQLGGLLTLRSGGAIALTDAGVAVSDTIFSDVFAALDGE